MNVKKVFAGIVLGWDFGAFCFLAYQYYIQYFVGHGELLLVDYSFVLFLEFLVNLLLIPAHFVLVYWLYKGKLSFNP